MEELLLEGEKKIGEVLSPEEQPTDAASQDSTFEAEGVENREAEHQDDPHSPAEDEVSELSLIHI